MRVISPKQFEDHLQRWLSAQATGQETDAHLLERFAQHGDDTAFAVLVQRYGSLVLRVCRRQLADHHEAEDAFQATFLVLARKAPTIRKRESLGAWLHGVAYRVSRRFRDRRATTAECPALLSATSPPDEASWRELVALLDEELHRLPEIYRVPLVLCHLQGLPQAEVAKELRLPLRTLEHRLAQGRGKLRQSLLRRGVEWAGVVLVLELSISSLPAALAEHTCRAALAFAAGHSPSVSTAVLTIAQSMSKATSSASPLLAALMVATVGVLGAGFSALAEQPVAGQSAPADPPQAKRQVAEDVLHLTIDRQGKLKVPGQQELLATAAEWKAYLRQQYQQAEKAAKAAGGADAKVQTVVRVTADNSGNYLPVYQVLQLSRSAGYAHLQLAGVAGPIELDMNGKAATVLIHAVHDGANDGAIAALVVDIPEVGETALPSVATLTKYLQANRDDFKIKNEINLQADGLLKYGLVARVANVCQREGLVRLRLALPPELREDKPHTDRPIASLDMIGKPQGTDDKARDLAVRAGLAWIVEHQAADGRWTLHAFHRDAQCTCQNQGAVADPAATGLALLPLLRAGHTHQAGLHAKSVERGLQALLAMQGKDGELCPRMYEHGIATMALCEAYGRTGDATLQKPAQKAIDYIIYAQHDAGGWRYVPRTSADLSVTGWQVQALWLGQQAGLKVPADTVRKAAAYIDTLAAPDGGYGYITPTTAPAMTATGNLCRAYLSGAGSLDPRGVAYLNKLPPQPEFRNVYYYYYASQVMNQDIIQGDPWNRKLRQTYLPQQDWGETDGKQHQKGSWNPQGDSWGNQLGRLGATSFALLALLAPEQQWPVKISLHELKEQEIAELWADLASDNGFRAASAMRALAGAPAQTMPLLQGRLRPVPLPDTKQVEQWIADLDNARFEVRQRASEELEKLGEAIVPSLRKVQDGGPSLELRQRVEQILTNVAGQSLSPEQRQGLRAIRTLEQIATPEAKKLLEDLVKGAAARQTREAQSALDRLSRRTKSE